MKMVKVCFYSSGESWSLGNFKTMYSIVNYSIPYFTSAGFSKNFKYYFSCCGGFFRDSWR